MFKLSHDFAGEFHVGEIVFDLPKIFLHLNQNILRMCFDFEANFWLFAAPGSFAQLFFFLHIEFGIILGYIFDPKFLSFNGCSVILIEKSEAKTKLF